MTQKYSHTFILYSIIIASLLTAPAFSILANSAFAQQVGVEVGVETEVEVKSGESEVEPSSETKDSAEAETESEKTQETKATAETKVQAKGTIKTSYPKVDASAKNVVIVQSKQMLYKPGDKIKVQGSLWAELVSKLGGPSTISIQIMDSSGAIVKEKIVEIGSQGGFDAEIELPAHTVNGEYTLKSKLVSDTAIGDLLGSEVTSDLQSSAKFVVSTPSKVKISVQDHGDFDVEIASSSKVSKVEFKPPQKKISLQVEGETGTKGVTQIKIPKKMLSGELTVLIDGKAMASDKVIMTSSTEAETTLELSYSHSVHTVEIIGTNAVPEFGTLSILVLVVAISSLIVVGAKTGLKIPVI